MTGERIPVNVLCTQRIANVSPALARELKLDEKTRSVALISTDCDDATYLALDEATKASDVTVAYARSLYAGAGSAATAVSGEVIGILAGPSPSEVESGLAAALSFLSSGVGFCKADGAGSVVYLAHCVSATGAYLSALAGIPQGQALAYLIAPPVPAVFALDAALKASDVEMTTFFAPPSETNFAGGLLTGTQSACMAACEAFADAVQAVAAAPLQ